MGTVKKGSRVGTPRSMKIILPPHHNPATPVTIVDKALQDDILDMCEMLLTQDFNGMHGIALAHPQVSNDPKQVFVMIEPGTMAEAGAVKPKLKIILNPRIIAKAGLFNPWEACLSFPDRKKGKPVSLRYKRLTVEFYDPKMERHEEEVDGLVAQVFQHEIEHFEGKNIYGAY